jgi:Arc/MetJ-type ribon-helix-helix transcriptional regulator
MRCPVSVSLKEETVLKIRERLRQSPEFRNKSHLVEYAVEKLLKEEKDGI